MSDDDGQNEMFRGAVSSVTDARILHSLSAYARAFGVRRETLLDRITTSGVEPVRVVGAAKHYDLRDVWQAFASAPGSGIDPDTMSPFNRRAWYQGERDKLAIQTDMGELIPCLQYEQELAGVLKIAAEFFDTLPDIIERDCGATPAQLSRLEKVCDQTREEMYRRLAEAERTTDDEEPATEPASKPAPRPKAKRQATSTLDAAGAFLQEMLAKGPKAAEVLISEATASSISESSLRRAKKKLGVVAKRAGKGWEWSLPDGEDEQGNQTG